MAKDKVLISGGTGYVGTPLLNFLKKKYDVKLISRKKIKHDIKIIKTKNLLNENDEWWKKKLQGIKYFIFLSWDVSHKNYTSSFQNLKWMTQVIRIAKIVVKNSSITSFACIGTGFEYGDGIYKRRLKIERPYTLYGFSKLTLFYFLQQIFSNSKINFIWFRIFHLFGENNEKKSRLYPYLLKCKKKGTKPLLKKKNMYYDYLHVQKAAKKIFNLIGSKKSKIVNIKSGERILISTFVKKVLEEKI